MEGMKKKDNEDSEAWSLRAQRLGMLTEMAEEERWT